jgi:nitrogen-specific signal transduction histidine kinase
MQALQSNTALELVSYSGKFAALRHITREIEMDLPQETVGRHKPIAVECHEGEYGVAEGAGLAHDASNLLGALSLYSDLLGMPGVLHEEHRGYAAELRMLSDRSWAMIDRLVNHAGAGRRPGKTAESMILLPDIIDRCKGLLSRVAGRTVETTYGLGAFQPVRVPAEAVERILTNLVKNAAEASPWVGAITIHVEGVKEKTDGGERRRVAMTVRDRGCGMDEAAVQRLMHGTGVSPQKGRGLGLRVVRELVAITGGCLSIESEPGVGTSIAGDWDAVTESEEAGQQAMARLGSTLGSMESETKTVLKGDAGWIAC